MVALIVRFNALWAGWERRREFCREDYLISVLAGSHPFTDPGLALFSLVVVCCVDEVATSHTSVSSAIQDNRSGTN